MIYHLLADGIVIIHLLFVLFVLLGGLLVLRSRLFLFLHPPALLWGLAVEFYSFSCPLTPLEKWLRLQAEDLSYQGGFINHYLVPIIYPPGITPRIQFAIGILLLLLNLVIYAVIYWRRFRR